MNELEKNDIKYQIDTIENMLDKGFISADTATHKLLIIIARLLLARK